MQEQQWQQEDMMNEKKRQLALFTSDMIIHTENVMDSIINVHHLTFFSPFSSYIRGKNILYKREEKKNYCIIWGSPYKQNQLKPMAQKMLGAGKLEHVGQAEDWKLRQEFP